MLYMYPKEKKYYSHRISFSLKLHFKYSHNLVFTNNKFIRNALWFHILRKKSFFLVFEFGCVYFHLFVH